jgi:glycosyltransferase involved in cell wall biosynthesis
MPVYFRDDPFLLEKALLSVYANSIQPAEVLVVVDGQVSDALNIVINNFVKYSNFKVIRLKVNSGITEALNVGLDNIESEWVFRADADDYNLPDRFEKQIPYLKRGYALVGGAIQEVDTDGKALSVRSLPSEYEDILRFAGIRNPFNHMTVAFNKKNVIDLGYYPYIYLREDYALWAKMLSKGLKAYNLQDVLVYASAGDQMIMRRGGFRYAFAELELQKHLVKCKLKNSLKAVLDGLMRSTLFICPFFIRKYVYTNYLRKNLHDDGEN